MNRDDRDENFYGDDDRLPHNRAGAPWYKRANVEPTLFATFLAFGLVFPLTSIFLFYARCIEIYAHEAPPPSTILAPLKMSNASEFCWTISTRNDTAAINRVEADVSNTRIFMQVDFLSKI